MLSRRTSPLPFTTGTSMSTSSTGVKSWVYDAFPVALLAIMVILPGMWWHQYGEWKDAAAFLGWMFSVIWFVCVMGLGAIKEWHHAYIGQALIIAGILLGLPWLCIVGLVVLADDAWQHLWQLHTANFHYESPLHWLYVEFVQRISHLFD